MVRNEGPHAASPSELRITLPAWLTPAISGDCTRSGQTVTCRIPPLQVGGSSTVRLPLDVSAAGGAGPLTASIAGHETELIPTNNNVTRALTGAEQADLALTLQAGAATIDHLRSTTLTATITNRGPSVSTGTVLSLRVPAGLPMSQITPPPNVSCISTTTEISCYPGNLAVDSSKTLTVTLTGAGIGAMVVTGEVDGAGSDAGTDQQASTTITVRPVGDASVTLAESADPVTVGTAFQYTATVRSHGPDAGNVHLVVPITGAVITDVAPSVGTCTTAAAQVACDFTALAPAATASVVISLGAAAPGIATAHAAVTFAGTDISNVNDAADIGTTMRLVGDLSVEIADTVDPAAVDAAYAYTVTVRNAGPNAGAAHLVVPVTGATVTGATSAATCTTANNTVTCDIASLASGAAATVSVNVAAAAAGAASATATATFSGFDPDIANNAAIASTLIHLVGDFSVEVADSVDPATVGSAYSYAVTVRNAGPNAGTAHLSVPVTGAAVTGTSVTATAVPGGIITGGICTNTASTVECDLTPIESGRMTVVTINVSTTAAGTATATATVTSTGTDLVTTNNSALTSTTVNAPAPPAPPRRSGGGGGGRFDWLAAMLLGLLLLRKSLGSGPADTNARKVT